MRCVCRCVCVELCVCVSQMRGACVWPGMRALCEGEGACGHPLYKGRLVSCQLIVTSRVAYVSSRDAKRRNT